MTIDRCFLPESPS